jgi:hypothetical protein
MIKEILWRELELKNFSPRCVPHCLSPTPNATRVETSSEMLRILHESEENHFEGIVTGDES